jgi:hypothetical protein
MLDAQSVALWPSPLALLHGPHLRDSTHAIPHQLSSLPTKDIATVLPLSKTAWVGAPMEYADTDSLNLLKPSKFSGVCNFPVKWERLYTSPELVNEHGF